MISFRHGTDFLDEDALQTYDTKLRLEMYQNGLYSTMVIVKHIEYLVS